MYRQSQIDRDRFGYVIAKAEAGDVADWEAAWLQARREAVDLVMVRVATDRYGTIHRIERDGGLLMDTLVHYRLEHGGETDVIDMGRYSVRLAAAADAEAVEIAARDIFADYAGHYHADPRLPNDRCDAVYSSWAASSCRAGDDRSGVILVECRGEIAAFGTVALTDGGGHDGILFGVASGHRGQGLYGKLMQLARRWGIERGSKSMGVSTQISNLVVQRAWCRQGFLPERSEHTFHVWA